jgi:hypothetical protein
MLPAAVRSFERSFSGKLIIPGDRDYDMARRVHNGAIDRHPAIIARCSSVGDVCRALEFARENQLLAAVRSGGHSQIGHSVCDAGCVIDLSGLKQASIDPVRRVVSAQAGLLAGELDRITQPFGLATALGQCPSVGIGGLTTGGGFGWLTGRYGLTCDNLISAQVVTADGHELKAAAGDNEDLFWAIRGGGGNYGIAVRFEYRLHPVRHVFGGMLSYPLSLSREGLVFMRDLLSRAPDELTLSFGIRPVDGTSCFAIAGCFCAETDDALKSIAQLSAFAKPISGSISQLEYLQMQSLMGESPSGSRLHTRGGFIRELSDAAIDTILQSVALNPCPSKSFWFDHYHGAMCRVPQQATAFPVREPGFGYLVQSEWDTAAQARVQIEWVERSVEAMTPLSAEVAYVANLGQESHDRIRGCYGPNYGRLAALKGKYDPANFFRLNQNIPPTLSQDEQSLP